MPQVLEILYSGNGDSVVLADPISNDDIAEVFHNDRHTVTQTPEQAVAIAKLFANADRLRSSLLKLIVIAGTPVTESQQIIFDEARAVLADLA